MLRRARALARALYPVPCPRRRCHQPCPPRDLAVPNAGWSERMRRHYGHQRDRARAQGWTRLPSYRQYRPQVLGLAGDTGATGDRDTRLFPRAIEGDGDGFEFAMFLSVPGGRLRCLCQLGPFLEAPPGLAHGGAIATLIDTSLGTLALAVAGRVVTANLNIDYVAALHPAGCPQGATTGGGQRPVTVTRVTSCASRATPGALPVPLCHPGSPSTIPGCPHVPPQCPQMSPGLSPCPSQPLPPPLVSLVSLWGPGGGGGTPVSALAATAGSLRGDTETPGGGHPKNGNFGVSVPQNWEIWGP
ncbi:acyl-coenzyme A thioesterase THEM4-like isoform X1 [Onychostruthus taczanowskii]|uniref:acyl-coenzyme A thioesterase THEM4-like isoform X1 n=1 Tax=Onychostruthus taczanowskii TaxID=356909 RepID=UPI001B803EE9|nr:acyl-coenzyme A thioesterase THEM4-like isoform X1 [Onychostruthus taczanowskii]